MSDNISNNKQIAKNLFFNSISFAINFIISFAFTPYLIRVVGKEAYSFFPLINNMIGYTSIITAAVGSMAGRFITMRIYKDDIEDANRYLNAMWVANLFLSIVFSLIGVVFIVYIDKVLTIPEYLLTDVQWLFGLGIFSMVLGLLTGYLSIPTYVRNRVDLSSSRNVMTNIIRIGAIFALFAIFRPSIVYMSLSALVASVVGIGINYNLKKKLLPELSVAPRKYFSMSHLKEMTSSGIWNSLTQLSNVLLTQVDLLIANIFISAAATGDLAIAKTVPTLILSLVGMLSNTFVSHFNILYAKGKYEEVISEINKSIILVSMVACIPIGFMLVFAKDFFNLWVPGQDVNSLYLLSSLTILPYIIGLSVNPLFGVFVTTNKLRIPSMVVIFASVTQTLVTILLLKLTDLGVFVIPLVAAAQYILRNIFFTAWYGAKCIERPWHTFYPTILRGIAGMVCVVFTCLIIRSGFTVNSWSHLFIVASIVGIVSICVNSLIILKKAERQAITWRIKIRIKKWKTLISWNQRK